MAEVVKDRLFDCTKEKYVSVYKIFFNINNIEEGLYCLCKKAKELNDSHTANFSGYSIDNIRSEVMQMLRQSQDPDLTRLSIRYGSPIKFELFNRASGSRQSYGWCIYIWGSVKNDEVLINIMENVKLGSADSLAYPHIRLNSQYLDTPIYVKDAKYITDDIIGLLDKTRVAIIVRDAKHVVKCEDGRYVIFELVKNSPDYIIFKIPRPNKAGRKGATYVIDLINKTLINQGYVLSNQFLYPSEAPNYVKSTIISSNLVD